MQESLGFVVDVSTALNQQFCYVDVVLFGREIQRRFLFAVKCVIRSRALAAHCSSQMTISHALGVGVRALVQQHLGYVQVIPERRRMQGGPAITGTKLLNLRALVTAWQNALFSLINDGTMFQQ